MASYVRLPAVAGRFYPGEARALRAEVILHLGDVAGARPALGVVAPHAGYMFSGDVAGHAFARLVVPRRVIVLGPNHTGRGVRVSVIGAGTLRIPGADVPVDEDLARAVLAEVPEARLDTRAHEHEHAIEVELPFLLARQPELKVVPIVLGLGGMTADEAIAVGHGLARAIKAAAPGEDALVVASSDMNHFLDDETTRRLDKLAIDQLLLLDAAGLHRTVEQHEITMCGYLPATAMLACARDLGAGRAELTGYATSGDASGDYERVVGYAGVIVS